MKYTFLLLSLLYSATALAGNLRAVVNDAPLFDQDVKARAALLKAQQPAQYEVMTKKELEKASLENLIDEKIKEQKTLAEGIKVSEADIDKAILHLEQQNGFSTGGLKRLLDESHVPEKTLRHQVYVDLMWLQYVRSQIQAPEIPKTAVQSRLNEVREQLKKPSFNVAEIVVPTLNEAQDIWENLQAGGSFEEMAQKYSQSKSAKNGGRVGVIEKNHYGKEIAQVMHEMPVGQVSRPLALKKGYLILLMIDKKAPVTGDDILIWELAQGGIDNAENVSKITQTKNCPDFVAAIKKYGISESVQQGWTDPVQLPTELKSMLEDTVVGDVFGPVQVPNGQLFFMKCAVKSQRVVPTSDEVQEQLAMEQMELAAKRLLKAEKRRALIEYK